MLIQEKIRQAYVTALAAHFDLNKEKVDKAVHLGVDGNWCKESTLEIHCEGEVPNASDYHDMRQYAAEFGLDPSTMGYYCHSEQWDKVDELANKLIKEQLPRSPKYYHEPYNGGVVSICHV